MEEACGRVPVRLDGGSYALPSDQGITPAPCRRSAALPLFARLPRIMSFSSGCSLGYLIRVGGAGSGTRWVH